MMNRLPFFPVLVVIVVVFAILLTQQPSPKPDNGPDHDTPVIDLGAIGVAARQGMLDYSKSLSSNFRAAASQSSSGTEAEVNKYLQDVNKQARQKAFALLDIEFEKVLGDGRWTPELAARAYGEAASGFSSLPAK